jgi:hypothetical protein
MDGWMDGCMYIKAVIVGPLQCMDPLNISNTLDGAGAFIIAAVAAADVSSCSGL